ncbi:hypothetical protein SLEP1_g599 [Rubroshorea leprosula]|uniref:Uncharacterized protein n=1 Tax=Rubroshorea leprosula TaxID=152421 RepID=A0AAV5HGP7_9ROSI|nr:hypothetical protein SLEP1_g599 [Rubroshorea leprosula]
MKREISAELASIPCFCPSKGTMSVRSSGQQRSIVLSGQRSRWSAIWAAALHPLEFLLHFFFLGI